MASENTTMQLFISSPTGTTRTYTFDADTDIEKIKMAVEDNEFIPSSLMRITHGTRSLAYGSLLDCGLNEGDSLDIMLNVNGGMRGKWKKKRMRRLRRKRRKMRQRAR